MSTSEAKIYILNIRTFWLETFDNLLALQFQISLESLCTKYFRGDKLGIEVGGAKFPLQKKLVVIFASEAKNYTYSKRTNFSTRAPPPPNFLTLQSV